MREKARSSKRYLKRCPAALAEEPRLATLSHTFRGVRLYAAITLMGCGQGGVHCGHVLHALPGISTLRWREAGLEWGWMEKRVAIRVAGPGWTGWLRLCREVRKPDQATTRPVPAGSDQAATATSVTRGGDGGHGRDQRKSGQVDTSSPQQTPE